MGFEPTRAEHIGLAVQRLNHSATSSCMLHCCGLTNVLEGCYKVPKYHAFIVWKWRKEIAFPYRELNPNLLGESQVS